MSGRILDTPENRIFTLIQKLRDIAEQLEIWADESIKGGWSTHQVDAMRLKATELRSFARAVANSR